MAENNTVSSNLSSSTAIGDIIASPSPASQFQKSSSISSSSYNTAVSASTSQSSTTQSSTITLSSTITQSSTTLTSQSPTFQTSSSSSSSQSSSQPIPDQVQFPSSEGDSHAVSLKEGKGCHYFQNSRKCTSLWTSALTNTAVKPFSCSD